MANRFTNYRTAKFNPLSMQEIMTPALAKQKQHDTLLADAATLDALDSQRLGADEEVVKGELDRIKQSASSISSQILNEGISRSSKFAFNDLRSQVRQAQSLEGVLGKAKTQFDKRQANVKAVMANKDLSQQQRQHGLNKALNDYAGISGTGYQDYVGANYVDVQEKALEVAKQMSPTELAESLGYEYDPIKKTYKDGRYSKTELSAEEISHAVNSYMMNDEGTASYLRDAQQIGLISNPKDYIKNAALNAGNIYKQMKLSTPEEKFIPKHVMETMTYDKQYMIDETASWGTTYLQSINEEQIANNQFDTDNEDIWNMDGSLKDFDPGLNLHTLASAINSAKKSSFSAGMIGKVLNTDDMLNDELARFQNRKNALNNFKVMTGNVNMSDKAAASLKNQMDKSTNAQYSRIDKPWNSKNTFYATKDQILGEAGTYEVEDGTKVQKSGDIINRGIAINGMYGGVTSFDMLAERYADGDTNKMLGMLKAGSMVGVSVTNPDMPGGTVFQFQDDEGEFQSITVEADASFKQDFGDAGKMTKAMRDHVPFQEEIHYEDGTGKPFYKYFVLNVVTEKDEKGEPSNPQYVPQLIETYTRANSREELFAQNPDKMFTIDQIARMELQGMAGKYNKTPQGSFSNKQGQ